MSVKTQMIEFPSNQHTTPGYLARPEDDEKHPGLVAIQEWWGLVPHIKDVAERFAREGFITLAPDLYHGETASEPDEARKMAMQLDLGRAVQEIKAAMTYLQNLEAVSPRKIGVVGWCMGGSLTISTAADQKEPAAGAAVVFYGRPREARLAEKIRAPLLGLYGENDHGIPVESVREFEKELKEAGVTHEIVIYPEAGHAFFNDTRPNIYNAEAAQEAWGRTLEWLRKYLR